MRPPERVTAALRDLPRPVCAYVYDTDALVERATAVRAALPPGATLLYAMKANRHPDVVRTLAQVCDGVEVASGGELERALAAGARRIVFGGPAKTDTELAAAIKAGAQINVESPHELRRIAAIARSLHSTAPETPPHPATSVHSRATPQATPPDQPQAPPSDQTTRSLQARPTDQTHPPTQPAARSIQANPPDQTHPRIQAAASDQTAQSLQANPPDQTAPPSDQTAQSQQAGPTDQTHPPTQTAASDQTAQSLQADQTHPPTEAPPSDQTAQSQQAGPPDQTHPPTQTAASDRTARSLQAGPTDQTHPPTQASPSARAGWSVQDGPAAYAGRAGPDDIAITVRVNRASGALPGTHRMTGVPTPFGVDEAQLPDLLELAAALPGIRVAGFHLHAVSNNLDAGAHGAFVADCLAWSIATAHRHGLDLRVVNAGGGLGVDYLSDATIDLTDLRDRLAGVTVPPGVDLIFEPGRILAADAGWYAAEVLDLKHTHGRTFAVLRGGTHHFRLPAAWGYSHPFTVLPVDDWPDGLPRPEVTDTGVDAVGELCTPRDVLTRGQHVDRLRAGDILVFGRTGAYGWDISHHDFLSHPPPTFRTV